jgi:hypothetical protein
MQSDASGQEQTIRTNRTRISLAQVRTGLALLLAEVEQKYGENVELVEDYYWTAAWSSAFRFDTADRPEVTVGQLTDDVASLQALLDAADDRPIVIWHDLAASPPSSSTARPGTPHTSWRARRTRPGRGCGPDRPPGSAGFVA